MFATSNLCALFNFQEIKVSNVQNILNDIRDKATGLYGIHFKFINFNQNFFAHLFCKFFNLMINVYFQMFLNFLL